MTKILYPVGAVATLVLVLGFGYRLPMFPQVTIVAVVVAAIMLVVGCVDLVKWKRGASGRAERKRLLAQQQSAGLAAFRQAARHAPPVDGRLP